MEVFTVDGLPLRDGLSSKTTYNVLNDSAGKTSDFDDVFLSVAGLA